MLPPSVRGSIDTRSACDKPSPWQASRRAGGLASQASVSCPSDDARLTDGRDGAEAGNPGQTTPAREAAAAALPNQPPLRSAQRPSSTVRAGHACADPGFQSFHELLVRERWGPAVGAGRPGPEDERIRLHVLDDVFAATAAAIPFRVFHLLADPAPSSGLPTAWTAVQGARSLRQERNHQPCSSPDDTSGTAAWARRGRPSPRTTRG